MSLTTQQVQDYVKKFKASYHGNINIDISVSTTPKSFYGEDRLKTDPSLRTTLASYNPSSSTIVLFSSNIHDMNDLRETLRHEVLGHYGLTLFSEEQRRALLEEVQATRKEPTLAEIWASIDERYSDKDDFIKAEEVFAHVAEQPRNFFQRSWDRVRSALNKSLRAIGFSIAPTIHELREDARRISQGIRDGKLRQQNLTTTEELFRRGRAIRDENTQDMFHQPTMVAVTPEESQTLIIPSVPIAESAPLPPIPPIETNIKKGRDGWEARSRIPLMEKRFVEIQTRKNRIGDLDTKAVSMLNVEDGGISWRPFDDFTTTLKTQSTSRVTENTVREQHESVITDTTAMANLLERANRFYRKEPISTAIFVTPTITPSVSVRNPSPITFEEFFDRAYAKRIKASSYPDAKGIITGGYGWMVTYKDTPPHYSDRGSSEDAIREAYEASQHDPWHDVHNIANEYGYSVNQDGRIHKANGKDTAMRIEMKNGRYRYLDDTNKLIFSTSSNDKTAGIGKFIESYWYGKKTQPAKEDVAIVKTFAQKRYELVKNLYSHLDSNNGITYRELQGYADTAFGGTQAAGVYGVRDAAEALEAAFNLQITKTSYSKARFDHPSLAESKIRMLADRIQKLPTQTRRDEEMEQLQQFSTPPNLAFAASWVANIQTEDVMLEPSAGTGCIAAWAQVAGATVVLNELSSRRRELLTELFPNAKIYSENAEQLHNVLPQDIKPTVIVMNPPFSSSAGRLSSNDTMIGARHIEQALKRLEPGGRLVAIVGNGMAADRPRFKSWWNDIKQEYTVLANVGIDGREYAKYGTTFDNNLIVIDKIGPTTKPELTGNVSSVTELPKLLNGVRNERKTQHLRNTEPTPTQPERQNAADTEPHLNRPQQQPSLLSDFGAGGVGAGMQLPIELGQPRQSEISDFANATAATDGNGRNDQMPRRTDGRGWGDRGAKDGELRGGGELRGDGLPRSGAGNGFGDSSGVDLGRTGSEPSSMETSVSTVDGRVEVLAAEADVATELSDSLFSSYKPQRINIPGAAAHPGKLVQTAAMAAVVPPAVTYMPALRSSIESGKLSLAQLEPIIYAGQAHQQILPDGQRKGFFIGDGTGVGKGREISGIIQDNLAQGRKKAVWVSINKDLIEDAKRDMEGIGGNPARIIDHTKIKSGADIAHQDGVLFTTYSMLSAGQKKNVTEKSQDAGKSRAKQIAEWLGPDFDGVIAFDEAHLMANSMPMLGKRGKTEPSQRAMVGINLQRELPKARVVYVSATGATEVSNLGYAERLGLWGQGTPFANAQAFVGQISEGGIAAMELVARDMKEMGVYTARSLSYEGVTYERAEHPLSEYDREIHDELALAWQGVLRQIRSAMDQTGAAENTEAKKNTLSAFWGTHQRFFNQVITSLQTPASIEHMKAQVEAGNSVVVQLVNTNEASQERMVAEAVREGADVEELDFTPRQILMDYVMNSFPVTVYEKYQEDGRTKSRQVKDSQGNPVFDRGAIAMRDSLLEKLKDIRVPGNPLDLIIKAFGAENVAEVTGRKRRFITKRDDAGELRIVEDKRGAHASQIDADEFQDGKKKVLVFSGAGGTGFSFHADKAAKNQDKRVHYILQPGWRADSIMQGFGRTHRTNQVHEPHYVFCMTNLKSQKRFISTPAKRLDQLGALTRGQREAAGQGILTAADNLESKYAKIGLQNFWIDLHKSEAGNLNFHQITRAMGLNLVDKDGNLKANLPPIETFLNRLLSLTINQQNEVFSEFEKRFEEAIDYAKEKGTFDEGMQTLKAKSIIKTRDDIAYEDKSGAKTRYVELDLHREVQYEPWKEVARLAKYYEHRAETEKRGSGFYVHEKGSKKGEVFFMVDKGEQINEQGNPEFRGTLYGIRNRSYIANADEIRQGWRMTKPSLKNAYRIEKETIARKISVDEAKELWHAQIEAAPKTDIEKKYLLVGTILPIWDRVVGSAEIVRLQTDTGEQMLGRSMRAEEAKITLKNLGVQSTVSKMPIEKILAAIQEDGQRAVLANGWEITEVLFNNERRIEVKSGGGLMSAADRSILVEQGAISERHGFRPPQIFIPQNANTQAIFERITTSKPVVDLIEKPNFDQTAERGSAMGR